MRFAHFPHITVILVLNAILASLALAQSQYNIYYGDIHSHTWYSDGSQDQNKATYTNPVTKAITYARTNANSMNFLGVSEHNHSQAGMSQSNWLAAQSEGNAANQDNVFVGMVGQEWGVISGGGHVLVYGTDKLFGWESGVYQVYVAKNAYAQLWDSVARYGGFAYLAHPQSGDYSNIFTSAYSAIADSVISGIAVKSGPATSTNTSETDPASGNYESKYHDMLKLGYHVAPCGNQDNHNTTFGRANEQRTAVLATSLTKTSILDALRNRHAYCTEDHNLQVRVECGSNIQGDIVSAAGTPNIRVKVYDPDGTTVTSIVLRYGVPGSGSAPTTLTTASGVDSLIYTTSQTVGATQYYYAYVTMSNGKHAWSAPIWLTRTSGNPPSAFTLTAPSTGATAQALSGTLSWAASSGATGYDVYLGLTTPPTTLVSSNQAGTSYNYSGLSANKTYYWKVTAKNTSGSVDATSSPFNFQTVKPIFGVNPSSLTYGAVQIGANKLDSVTVSNTGTSNLVIDSVRSDNARFTVTPGGATIAPSGSQKYYVTFAPTSTAAQNANVRFYHNATGSPSAVTASGSGIQLSIVSSTHTGGTISPVGTVGVNSGSNQPFTIWPNTGYHIDSVVADGVNAGAVGSYTFTNITANHTISAWFSINTYTIAASAGSHGSISPAGTTVKNYGDSLVYTMTADPTYSISDVVVDGISQGPVGSYTFRNISGSHTIVASFGVPGTFTITSVSGAHGTVTPPGAQSVTQNTNQSFTITPDAGYHIDSVYIDGAFVGTPASYAFNNVIANHTLRAVFAPTVYTISLSVNSGGTVNPAATFSVMEGSDTTLSFTPSTGYVIDSVIVDGSFAGTPASHTFSSVSANHSVAVRFRHLSYTITAGVSGSGTVSPAGITTVYYGENATCSIIPDAGSHLDSLIVDGAGIANAASYQFTNVTANHTIAAYFSVNVYTVTITGGANGSVSPEGTLYLPHGTDTTITFTPETGYEVSSLLIDGVSSPVSDSYTFTGLSGNHTVAVSFQLSEYVLEVSIVGGGTVTRSPEQDSYQYGTEVGLTAASAHGYRFANWSGGANSILTGVLLLMDGPKNVIATFEGIPVMEPSVESVSFSPVVIGNEGLRTFMVRNTGAATLHISSIAASLPEFTVTPPNGDVPAGDSLLVQVLFTPTAAGVAGDTVTILHDADGSPVKIPVSGSGAFALRTVSNASRWNLISNPLQTDSNSLKSLFPGSSYTYGYSYGTGGYSAQTDMSAGTGYWAKFASAGTSNLSGYPIASATIPVTAGWNLVGTVSDAVAASSIQYNGTAAASALYGYSSGYVVSDSVVPGRAYWLRVTNDGSITLNGGTVSKTSHQTVLETSMMSRMTAIQISDAGANTQTLYLAGAGTFSADNAARYELPPLPPQGVFDARFHSRSQVEMLNAGPEQQRFTVNLSSASYPVRVSLAAPGNGSLQYTVRDGSGNVVFTSKPGTGGEAVIPESGSDQFTISVGPVPVEFSLSQNYPNPFNPVSNIRFALPVESRVTLTVFDILGREVARLVNGELLDAGYHQEEFNGANLGSGVYFYRIEAVPGSGSGSSFSKVMKMALIK